MRTTSTLTVVLALFAFAAPAAAHRFEARSATPTPPAELVSSEIAWHCTGPSCAADAAMVDAPARLCSRLARDIGKLETFSVDGAAMPADALTKCDARAK